MLRSLLRSILPNPFDCLLKKAAKRGYTKFILAWNRGLGDIPLGLFALTEQIRKVVPDAKITFITRKDLQEGFSMLKVDEILIAPWKRGEQIDLKASVLPLRRSLDEWDVVIEKPDPTYWVRWQLGTLTPRLSWNPSWDHLVENFDLDLSKRYIGVHLQTETNYGYEKNWPLSSFSALIDILITKYGKKVILFGSQPSSMASRENVVDLRGKTTLTQMLSIIKNLCSHLIAPDSGVLSMTYYIDSPFPLYIVSLWADPCQGVLKQAVASPNNLLMHIPLIAEGGDLRGITVEKVLETLALTEGTENLSP